MAIGETFLGAVLQVVLERLASKQVIAFFKPSKIDQSLVDKLKHLMHAAGTLLADAEQKQMTDDNVKLWLDDLKHLFYRAEEIADEIVTEAKRSSMDLSPEPKSLGSKVWYLIPAYRSPSSFASAVNSHISEVVNQLHDMLSHSVAVKLKGGSAGVNTTSRRETTSYLDKDDEVFGRVQEKKKLLKFLFSEEAETKRIGVVAIVGMGGMGKTTLAKLVFNDESLEDFDLKAWVYVSDQFDISRVIKSILQRITGQPYSGSLELEFLHHEFIEKLRGKRFFLVLDDVWNENYEDWKSLLAPLKVGAHGSKIIVTTRNEEVASIMGTVPVIRLKPLSNEDGWLLFSKHAFEVGNLSSDPCIESYGRKIVDKCQGLALTIKTLGGLLRSKEDIHEWKEVLESSLWDLPNTKGSVAALRLSYYHLPSHLKRCFSYCAIFPKGYVFDKKMLVRLWMAEGFVKPSGGRSIEDIGEDYLNKLLSCSFFDRSGNRVVMHDLMHDLAEAVSGVFFARLDDEDQALSIDEKARYFSFANVSFVGLSRLEGLHEAKYLRTFVSYQTGLPINNHMSSRILVAMIPQFYCLRILSVSSYEVIELPESIRNLKQLRYLDVSRTGIKELPKSVSTLCNLESLLLSWCDALERLPADMSKLVSLRYLDVSNTRIKELPESVSTLCNLQSLLLSGCNNLEQLPAEMSNLVSLRCLDVSNTRIKEVHESVSTLCNLESLVLSGCNNLEQLPADMSKLVSLRYLDVSNTRIKELPESVSTLCNLQSLVLSRCNNLEQLPADMSKLVLLRYLDVSNTRIKELPESVSTLCNLESLVLSGCNNLEQLPADMCKLVSLRHLDISYTTSLRQMPKHMSKLKCLQTLSGFVVGKHCGQGIEELRDLQHIRGKLALRSLQNISSPEFALDANLSCRVDIDELEFEYDDSGDYGSKMIEMMLENLQPHPNLENVTIRSYPATQFPSWLDTQCLMIVNLTLEGCKNCYRLPALGQLPSLKHLEIVGMENIEVIGCEFYGYDSGLVNPFPVLQKLVIRDMKYWKEWSGYEMEDRVPFPCLEVLGLYNCPELVSLPSEVCLLSCLETLCLEGCEKLKSLRNVRLPTKLGSLDIRECKILESLPQEMELLNNLWRLELISCPCVKSAPKDTLPTSLQSLYVEWCKRWEFPIPEVEKMQCYTALEHLSIINSGGATVSFPLGGFPNLRNLRLENLIELERVNIPTGVDLINLTSLQRLSIRGCGKLRWIGKTEEKGVVDLPAPNLQRLEIIRCELVKPLLLSGDREGLPSKLKSLNIDINNLNTVTSSHRKCQNLLKFTCLRELMLGRHVAEYFPDKGCSLPVSITLLSLCDCPNLKRLNGEALKSLTSLKQLRIRNCPNVECLPEEGLPPSLGCLEILECPKLEERCKSDTGLDWPIIQHLPCVKINELI